MLINLKQYSTDKLLLLLYIRRKYQMWAWETTKVNLKSTQILSGRRQFKEKEKERKKKEKEKWKKKRHKVQSTP